MTRFKPMWLGTLANTIALQATCIMALLCVTLWAANAYGYRYYDNGSGSGCVQCHPQFDGPQQLLHAYHTSKFGVTDCNLCHPNGPGSVPVATYWSGPGGGFGCTGCHGRDYGEVSPNSGQLKATGYGLRSFHVNQGVASCGSGGCHQPGQLGHWNPFPAILGEDLLPPYYGLSTNNLTNPCSSAQEDSAFDADSVGLDNDGDGAADWPADLDCDIPVTTSTTTTTTTTTLPLSCGPAPAAGCVTPSKARLVVNEKKSGKEKLKVSLAKLQPAVMQNQFGSPVVGTTSYAVCIYDELDQLSGEIFVSRAGDICGSPPKPCWSMISSKGYKYVDKTTAADGILKMVMVGGDPGKGKVVVVGKNKASAQQTSLPTGIAPMLLNNSSATVQVLTSDAACFAVTATQVKKADGFVFTAIGP